MNQPATSPRRLHPLIATAAGTVIIASLAATAAITGLFPKASSTGAQTDQAQSAQVANQPVVDTAAPAASNYGQQTQAATGQTRAPQAAPQTPDASAQPQRYAAGMAQAPAYGQQPYAQQPQQPQPQYAQPSYAQSGQSSAQQPQPAQPQQRQYAACASCGTVESISAIRREGQGTGVGAVGGAVAGGLIGNQFGRGTGRTAMTVLGAVGGGFAGNAVEKRLRSETDYQVRVRMDNGRTRYFTYRQTPPFGQGQPVRIVNGALVAR